MKKLSTFFYSTQYLIILSAIALIIWNFNLDIVGVPILLTMTFLFLVFNKDTMPSVPLIMNALFMVSFTQWDFESVPLFIYMTPIALIGGMIIHIIRFKVSIFKGKMMLGILLMVLATFLSTLNAVKVDFFYVFYISIGLLYALIYLFFRNTFDRDHIQYLYKMMSILGILVSVQIILYYLKVDDFYYALEYKTINLGWGISNYIATYLLMFLSITLYFVKTSSKKLVWLIVSLVEGTLIFFTASRGGMLTLLVMIPIYLFLLQYRDPNRKKYLVGFIVIFVSTVLFIFVFNDFIQVLFARFRLMMLDDPGRLEMYREAIDKFIANPLFGGGLFARVADKDYTMYHNTIFHVMATFGSVGLIALGIQIYQQFKITLDRFKYQNIFLALALLAAHIHGMVDNVYLMPQFMVLMMIIVSVVEVARDRSSDKAIVINQKIS